MVSPPAHDVQAGYMRSMSKPFHFIPRILQNSPSRFGLQPVQRFAHGRPTQFSDWNQIKAQAPPSGFGSGGPRSPRNSSFANSMPWGIQLSTIIFINLLNFSYLEDFFDCYAIFHLHYLHPLHIA